MLRITSAFFLALLHCCNANQTKTSQVSAPADCETVETDAGIALDLVNRHRQDGYVFGLFRVADVHKLHTENSSVLYLTLDVLETECSVLSGRPWETCEYGDLYSMDFGQCKIITYTSRLLKKPKLYGYNCTLSPVPPDLIECKDCPVKVEVLEVTKQHKDIAAKLLEKFNREGNHTNYFKVNKVEKILKATASREVHILGFSIKETNCSRGEQQQADVPLECEFLDDWHAHTGFCKARTVSDPDEPNGIEINCELYHPWQRYYGQRCRSPAPGWPHKHPHHHRHRHRHRGPPTFQFKPEDSEHNHGFNKDHQGSHKAPPPPCHNRQHDHPHPPHHGQPPPPQEEPEHPSSIPPLYDKQDRPLLIQEKSDFPPSTPPPYDEQQSPPPPPHHRPHRPPPHGHHHPHHPHHHGPYCPPPHGHHHPHHSHHHGPHCPPPHEHHHPHHPHHHGPYCPPPHGHHHPPPPPHHGPDCPPPHGHHHPPPPPHHGPHCPPPHGHHHPPPPPEEKPEHPSSTPPLYDKQDRPPLIQEKSDFPPSTPPPYDEQQSPPPPPHHGPHCPPPHGHHHPHHSHHHGPHCPPPHGHHHPHHPHHHGPYCPPPHGHHHPPPPPHHGPHCPPPPPPPGHHPYLYHHYHRHHCNKTHTSGKYFPFQVAGAVYRIPVLNMQDSLTPPSAKFPELSLLGPHSVGTDEGTPLTDSSVREMPEAPQFPDHPSQSKSCPGKPKLDLPKILPLLPHKSMAETVE